MDFLAPLWGQFQKGPDSSFDPAPRGSWFALSLSLEKLSYLTFPRVARKGKFQDGLESPTLTDQDSCVLVNRVKGALALPIHDLVYQDGQQEGILQSLEGGRGWEPRMPGSHI